MLKPYSGGGCSYQELPYGILDSISHLMLLALIAIHLYYYSQLLWAAKIIPLSKIQAPIRSYHLFM